MNRPPSPPRRQRACVPCSKAKARCHFGSGKADQNVCDRCEKMEIFCTAKTTKSLRKPRQIKPLNSRVSVLEQRLETLVSEFEDRNAQKSPAGPSGAAQTEQMPSAVLAIRTPESSTQTPSRDGRDDAGSHNQKQKEPQQAQASSMFPPPLDLTWPQAERILTLFRDKYMYNFPFVIVEEETTAHQLLEEKPFLFRAIMLVAAPLPVPRIKKMKRSVLAYLGAHLLVEEERHLELFQGLLVCIAWADFKSLYDEQITTMTYLALGFAHNLGVTRIPHAVLKQIGLGDGPEDVRASKESLKQKMHSAEEQRAFLGCYSLLAANSNQFGRLNPLKSQYVNLCCDSLNWTQGYPSDFFLERTVRIIQMGEKISEAFGAANDQERSKPYLFLVEGNASGFRTELDRIMESLSHEQLRYDSVYGPPGTNPRFEARKRSFSLYYNYLLVRLYEPATYLPEASQEGGAPSMYRSMCLRNCLFAAKAYFDELFEVPVTQFLYHSINTMQQTAFIMIITTRLLLIDAPDWDADFARLTLDFESTMTRLIERLHQSEAARAATVRQFVKEMGVEDVTEEELEVGGRLMDTAEKSTWMRDWFNKRTKGDPVDSEAIGEEMGTMGMSAEWQAGDVADMAFNDSPWWMGLLGNSAWNFDDVNM